MKPIFETVKELGIPFDSHETDLYIPCTPQTETLPAWERKGV